MWPTQRLDTVSLSDDELKESITSVLQLAQITVAADRLQLRFIVFPVFLAGFASFSGSDKMLALDLISAMDRTSIGRNTGAARDMLKVIYERQTQRFMGAGHSLDVDWIDVMAECGVSIVNFGM